MNITYIISNIDKAFAFEWISTYLNKKKFELNFILLNSKESELETYLRNKNISVERITYTSKKNIPKAILLTYKLLKKHKTQIVHTHLFEANIVGLTAAWLAGVPKRIHTRHHSNYHHIYYPKAVKYDRIVNRLSTDIIAISEVVKDILITKENVASGKIHLIHHGFQFTEFMNVSELAVNKLKQKYIPNNSYPVAGVISRYTEWKGIQYIIPAFEKLLNTYPNALLILANTTGDYKNEIKKMLQTIPKNNYIEIPFETDIFSLYKLFDIFIHIPITVEMEAFGQTYIEALAARVPSVFTLSGIANEFIKDHHNALVVPHKNSDATYNAMKELLENKTLTANLMNNGEKDVTSRFSFNKMILSLELLYGK